MKRDDTLACQHHEWQLKYNNQQSLTWIIMFRKILLIPLRIQQNGLIHSLRIGYIYLIEPYIVKMLHIYTNFLIRLRRYGEKIRANHEMRYWKERTSVILSTKKNSPLKITELGLDKNALMDIHEQLKRKTEVEIAKIDQDGFFLSNYGDIETLPCVEKTTYLPRIRFLLSLVAIGEFVGVKKAYRGCAVSFIREIKALYALNKAGCNVPAILDVDFEKLTLTIAFIPGLVLREELASRGAILRDRDVEDNLEFNQIPLKARRLKRIQEGKKYLQDVVNDEFIEMLFDQVSKIHHNGFLINDIKYGNVIIEKTTGEPYLIDFEGSDYFGGIHGDMFRILIDKDIEQFNLHYNTNKKTYWSLKRIIDEKRYPFPDKWYSPSYFGFGLNIGDLSNPEVGWGRWHYILKDSLPNLNGKRVLDLGSNNGFIPLQFLKNGAKEVIGFERDQVAIKQSKFLMTATEWAENGKINFKCIPTSMSGLIAMDLGRFDLVTALCSIYYLDEQEIHALIKHISTITDLFIVQCNVAKNIGRQHVHTYKKASLEYLKDAMEKNGFPWISVISPRGYSRPILVGHKKDQT